MVPLQETYTITSPFSLRYSASPFCPPRPPILLATMLTPLPLKSPPSSPHLPAAALPLAFAAQLASASPPSHSPSVFFVPLSHGNTHAKATHNCDTANAIDVSISLIRPLSSLFVCFLFLFWPHLEACGILVPRPGIEPMPPTVEAQSHNSGRQGSRDLSAVLTALATSPRQPSLSWMFTAASMPGFSPPPPVSLPGLP